MALITDLRELMLESIGESDYASVPTNVQNLVLTKLNAVCQTIWSLAPGSWWQERPAGELLLAPVTLSSMTVTAASKSFSGSGLTSRMHGCTVQVSGQTTQNRIFQTGASTWVFLLPHEGSTSSSATITVYHDCLTLTDTPITIIRPVMVNGLWELLPLRTQADLQLPTWYANISHNSVPTGGGGYPVSGWQRQFATPRTYFVDGTQLYGGSFVTQLRFNPMPDAQYLVSWQQKEKFAPIANWSDTRTVIVPHQYESGVLVPLLIESLMRLPNFQGSKDDAAQDAAQARAVLADLSRPQEEKDQYVNVGGGW